MSETIPQQVIPGVFESREAAEKVIVALRGIGLADADIGVVVPQPGMYDLSNQDFEVEADEARSVRSSIAVGGVTGAIGGMGLMALILSEVGTVGVGGLLAGAYGGTVWGIILGGLSGLWVKLRWNAREDRWCEIPITGGHVLVAARADGKASQVRRIMEQYGARCFLDPAIAGGEMGSTT